MALSIKTAEADALARRLVILTGESLTTAVTIALRERVSREEARRTAAKNLPRRLGRLAERLRGSYDTQPVTREEWDAAAGDET
jgi:antitoxin VapB